MSIITHSVFEAEKAKYEKVWSHPEYRATSFGSQLLGPFLSISNLGPGSSVVDVGCGSGRASLKLAQMMMDVTMIDATATALDIEVEEALHKMPDLHFVESCLWHNWVARIGGGFDFAYCCDVLEHIPTEFTMLVAALCVEASDRAFFHINFDPDFFGKLVGEPLHLTVKPFEWWRDRLGELGKLTDARDMLGHGMYIVEGQ